MNIYVDADACPKTIKEILFRASLRTQIPVILVSNLKIRTPDTKSIKSIQVDDGPDVADDEIVTLCQKGDLVITADIPLAARVIKKGAIALDPRGTLYDRNNIGHILGIRDFMDNLRGSGIVTNGPKSMGEQDRKTFANELDKIIAKR